MSDGDITKLITDPDMTLGSTDHVIALAAAIIDAAAAALHPSDGEPTPGFFDGITMFRQLHADWCGQHPEATCHRCGHPFTDWSAPSPLWNEVMRGGDINGAEPYRGIVCPPCFIRLAEAAGIATGWRLYAATVFRHLQTVTPSGRVWNPETWMFDEPARPTASQVITGSGEQGNPPPINAAGQNITGSTVAGGVTQISGVKGDVHL